MKISRHPGYRGALLVGCASTLGLGTPVAGQETLFASPSRLSVADLTRQTSSVRGFVRDSAAKPIPFATVVWGQARQAISTTDSGSFELHDIPAVKTRFTVRRLGYVPVDFYLTLNPGALKPVVVNLIPVPSPLTDVEVEAHGDVDNDHDRAARFAATGFFDRKARLPGYFVAPESFLPSPLSGYFGSIVVCTR